VIATTDNQTILLGERSSLGHLVENYFTVVLNYCDSIMSVVMLNATLNSVVILNVVILIVEVPYKILYIYL